MNPHKSEFLNEDREQVSKNLFSHSKWIVRLNIKNKTIQVLEENMDEFIFSFDIEKDCLTMTHKPEAKKEKIQLKKFSWQKK